MVFYNENRVGLSTPQCWHMLGDFLEHCKKYTSDCDLQRRFNRVKIAAWCSPEAKHRAYTKERNHDPHGRAALVS